MKLYRIAENEHNIECEPWTDAIGIEEIDTEFPLTVPALVCWLTRGEGQEKLAHDIIRLLNKEYGE